MLTTLFFIYLEREFKALNNEKLMKLVQGNYHERDSNHIYFNISMQERLWDLISPGRQSIMVITEPVI